MKFISKLSLTNVLLLTALCLLTISCKSVSDVPACKKFNTRIWKNPATDHLEIKASPLCWDTIKEASCMRCKFTLSDRVEFVGEEKQNWKDFGKGLKPMSQYEAEAIILPAEESYAPLSVDLINLCKMSNCNKDVTKFKVKMDSISKEK